MVYTLFMFLLAALGLGFLIFIHELGHYLMARRVGMRVEVFSIGFGKPLKTWMVGGVKWQIGTIPLGGYVKIAGMEQKGSIEPYEVTDGYFGKSPWKRILVAVMGPLSNIIFAFLAFTLIWALGGRKIPFATHTKVIGWVAKDSALYQADVRAGDELLAINGRNYQGYQDFLFAAAAEKEPIRMDGLIIDYWENTKNPFQVTFDPKKDLSGSMFFIPADFLKYDRSFAFQNEGWSSLTQSGIQKMDRIVAIDGQLIFSKMQMVEILNEPKVVLTVQRNGKTFITRVPRLQASDIQMSALQKAELDDWQHESKLFRRPEELYFIPYSLTTEAVIEGEIPYFNEQADTVTFQSEKRRALDFPLQKGDKIMAVDGIPISSAAHFLNHLQTRKAQVIVRRDKKPGGKISADKADKVFTSVYNPEHLTTLIQSIGQSKAPQAYGELVLLLPIDLIKVSDVPYSPEMKAKRAQEYEERRKSIEAIEDPKERKLLLKELEFGESKLVLGGRFEDELISYNPSPFTLFGNTVSMTGRTLSSLIVGHVSPKHIAGPVVIVSMMQQSFHKGAADGLYWLGFISLNLAIFNLLPVPVLDGGHICFSLYEIVTKKRLRAKTMEKLIIPFVILMILFFLYVTYNDILRVIKGMF